MGICFSERNRLNKILFSEESYSNFDKTVYIQKLFMEDHLTKEEISPFFSKIIYDQILEEKKI